MNHKKLGWEDWTGLPWLRINSSKMNHKKLGWEEWTGLPWLRIMDRWRALVNAAMNLRAGNLLTS
jgi:hypothetical protein